MIAIGSFVETKDRIIAEVVGCGSKIGYLRVRFSRNAKDVDLHADKLRVICGEPILGSGRCDFAKSHARSTNPTERIHGFRGGRF